jgi:hypothetical protein
MAELVNLQNFDKHLEGAREELKHFADGMKKHINVNIGSVWSKTQMEELSGLYNAITHLHYALRELAHNNRDGRDAPPRGR